MDFDHAVKYEIFQAQTENVKELDKAWKQVVRTIHANIVRNDESAVKLHTKILALLFSAWSEAIFMKLIHTPYGFELSEIKQIKNQRSFEDCWGKCLELGLNKIQSSKKSNYIPNIRQDVTRLINQYVIEPYQLRNRIAHGQWRKALNSESTAINYDMTKKINELNVVKLDIWKNVFISLSNIIEVLIESPNRIFHRDFQTYITTINEEVKRTEKWTFDERVKKLRTKYEYYKGKKQMDVK